MRARFLIVNTTILALVYAAYRIGLFDAFAVVSHYEIAMLGFLCAYACMAFAAGLMGYWEAAGHVANGIPMWGLGFTGLGMMLAVYQADSVTPTMFRELALSIAPNVLGVILMAWIRELAWWSDGQEV